MTRRVISGPLANSLSWRSFGEIAPTSELQRGIPWHAACFCVCSACWTNMLHLLQSANTAAVFQQHQHRAATQPRMFGLPRDFSYCIITNCIEPTNRACLDKQHQSTSSPSDRSGRSTRPPFRPGREDIQRGQRTGNATVPGACLMPKDLEISIRYNSIIVW